MDVGEIVVKEEQSDGILLLESTEISEQVFSASMGGNIGGT